MKYTIYGKIQQEINAKNLKDVFDNKQHYPKSEFKFETSLDNIVNTSGEDNKTAKYTYDTMKTGSLLQVQHISTSLPKCRFVRQWPDMG